MKIVGKRNIKLINLLLLVPLYSCGGKNTVPVNPGQLSTEIKNSGSVNKKNSFDPSGGGVIDPGKLTDPGIILENGKGKILFTSGGNNLSLNLKLAPFSYDTAPILPLTGLKVIKTELYINNNKFTVEIPSEKIPANLNYSLELSGLSSNSTINLKATVIDKNNKTMGTRDFQGNLNQSGKVLPIEILLAKWW